MVSITDWLLLTETIGLPECTKCTEYRFLGVSKTKSLYGFWLVTTSSHTNVGVGTTPYFLAEILVRSP